MILLVRAGLALPFDSGVGVGLALPIDSPGGARLALPNELNNISGRASPTPTNASPTLGDIIGAFKSVSTINVNRMLSGNRKPLWHRNYYEHVIRDEESLNRIREYIVNNPLSWSIDRENPDRKAEDPFDKWIESFRALRDEVQKQKTGVKI